MAYKNSEEALRALQDMKYTESDRVNQAYNQWQQYENNKPSDYQSKYQQQIDKLLGDIVSRKDFSYNMNADPLYQTYKDQYVNNGRMAMMDTTANAATLTGGYGNSYAATAGNQAYQQQLNNLNSVTMDLYDRALAQYQNKGTDMRNNLSTLQGVDQLDYGKYRDNVSDYYTNRDYYQGKYNNAYGQDYNQYSDQQSLVNSIASQLMAQEQAARNQANWEREYALSQYARRRDPVIDVGGGEAKTLAELFGLVSAEYERGGASNGVELANNKIKALLDDGDIASGSAEEKEIRRMLMQAVEDDYKYGRR